MKRSMPGLLKLVQHLARGSVWDRSGIRLDTKLKVYSGAVNTIVCM